jgi:uroporphyrinogen III methyltransferase/synthase
MNQLKHEVGDIRWMGGLKIAAVGTGTARALQAHDLKADFVPTVATVAGMAEEMAAGFDWGSKSVVRVMGNLSDSTISDSLTAAGATVTDLEVYETYHPDWPGGFKERLLEAAPDVILFSSGSTVGGLTQKLTADELVSVTRDALIVSIGPMTSRHIEKAGLTVGIESEIHSIPAMVDRLVAHYSAERKE